MAALNDLRNGLVVRLDNVMYTITDCQHVKPGKGGAFARIAMERCCTLWITKRLSNTNYQKTS